MKLLNNALGTYNLAATARMLNLSEHLGIPAGGLFEVIGVSTGRNWMSDNFIDVQHDLLLNGAALLRGEIGSLPAIDIDDDVEQSVLQARALLPLIRLTSEPSGKTPAKGYQLWRPSSGCAAVYGARRST